jgi:hypothetical protein
MIAELGGAMGELAEQHHKLLAIVLHKFGFLFPDKVILQPKDVEAFEREYSDGALVVCPVRLGLQLRLVGPDELARIEGA